MNLAKMNVLAAVALAGALTAGTAHANTAPHTTPLVGQIGVSVTDFSLNDNSELAALFETGGAGQEASTPGGRFAQIGALQDLAGTTLK